MIPDRPMVWWMSLNVFIIFKLTLLSGDQSKGHEHVEYLIFLKEHEQNSNYHKIAWTFIIYIKKWLNNTSWQINILQYLIKVN